MTRGRFVLVLILSLAARTRAQDACDAKQQPRLEHGAYVFFGTSGTTFCWKRPEQVRFAIVRACGAGGGGSQNADFLSGVPGPDGFRGRFGTELIGPLTDTFYEVVLGKGGATGTYEKASEPGGPTIMTGADVQLTFSGGPGIPPFGVARDLLSSVALFLDLPRHTGRGCDGGVGGIPGRSAAQPGQPGELILAPIMDVDQTLAALHAAEVRLEGKMVTTMNALPQKILADTAATSIHDTLLLHLEERLEQLRKDIEILQH